MTKNLKKELELLKNPKQAEALQRFFKTNKGEYGEGDIFLGIKVPKQREIAKRYKHLSLEYLQKLIDSDIHEYRLTSLFILIHKYNQAREKEIKKIIDFYLKNLKKINNWDLVDLSAPKILGHYLKNRSREILYKLANSKNLWEKRIAILSAYTFIRENDFKDALKISEILLKDKHDLIHKAVGWMLREIGKRDLTTLETFLKKHCKTMPRTCLRYAIEKFSESKRKVYTDK